MISVQSETSLPPPKSQRFPSSYFFYVLPSTLYRWSISSKFCVCDVRVTFSLYSHPAVSTWFVIKISHSHCQVPIGHMYVSLYVDSLCHSVYLKVSALASTIVLKSGSVNFTSRFFPFDIINSSNFQINFRTSFSKFELYFPKERKSGRILIRITLNI